MHHLLTATAMFVPGFIRIGGIHLPVYGLFVAAGLVVALWLSQQTARPTGLAPEKLWDAGVFAVIAAFVTSRLLLVAFDFKAFLAYPLLVLALPSLTYGGMVLTGLLTFGWLRYKRLPILDTLDAWAPCTALLAAILSIAHFVEGTDAGMPTHLPWGVITSGDTILGPVHPVQLYTAFAAVSLGTVLWRRLPHRRFPGEVASLALMLGGTLTFLLNMLQQPLDTVGDTPLDPGQFVALAAMLAGAALYTQVTPQPYAAAQPHPNTISTMEESR